MSSAVKLVWHLFEHLEIKHRTQVVALEFVYMYVKKIFS